MKATVSYTAVDTAITTTLYILSCIGMSCFQKMAIVAFPRRNVLISMQAGLVLVLLLCFRWHSIHLGQAQDFWRFLPICLCFTLMLMASMLAYQYCTLGTIVVIGALCPLLTLPVEVAVFERNPLLVTRHTIGSMVLTVVGVALYGFFQGQLSGQWIGISAMVFKTLINVYYQTRMRYLMVEEPVDINDEGMMLYNNGIALAGTMATVMATGEYVGLSEEALGLNEYQWTWVLGSCIFCYAISYFSFRCQRQVSATSFHILGNVSKVVVVLFGWVVLNEAYNLKSATAVCLALVGAAWYSWDRIMDEPREEDYQGYVSLTDNDAHLSPYIKGRSESLSGLRPCKLGPSAAKQKRYDGKRLSVPDVPPDIPKPMRRYDA
ncbi:hypothetical protein AAMO2058_001532900 [Amorphochlora amoebiformis]